MVEVVVSLAEGDESGDDVVTRGVAVVERLVTKPVGERVDAESSLLDEADTEDTGINEAAEPVIPAKAADNGGQEESESDNTLEEVGVLPDDDGVLVEVGDVGTAGALGVLLHDHPAEVRVEETLADRVGILFGVGIAVVSTVTARPPADGALDGTSAHSGKVYLEGQRSLVRGVSPETVVACKMVS